MSDKKYEPELGQMVFDHSFQSYEGSNLLKGALLLIKDKIETLMWNIHKKRYDAPFISGMGNETFQCDAFEVVGYLYDEEQDYNFKYEFPCPKKDGDPHIIKINWYKHFMRGLSINEEITPDDLNFMLNDCIACLDKMSDEHFKKKGIR